MGTGLVDGWPWILSNPQSIGTGQERAGGAESREDDMEEDEGSR